MNLLTDPILRVQTSRGLERLSLPQLLAALGTDDVLGFPGIQRHQEDAFYVFLCYLAGAILARSGKTNPVQSPAFWENGMRDLAPSFPDQSWTLVVDDLAKPAFLQPPLPSSDHDKLKLAALSPDALDLLPTAKNHDLKQVRASQAELDEWVFALVSLQTMSGYFGRGNPGIARMNSGFGNRPVVEIAHDVRWGPRFRQAIPRLLSHRRDVLEGEWNFDPNGLVLTWVESWDGNSSIGLSHLDPFFLEVCRRVRLRGSTQVVAYSVPSAAGRIQAKSLRGIVGDAWLPVEMGNEAKALTLSAQGWTPDLLRRLIFEENFQLTPLQRPLPDVDGPVWLLASALVRGQGTTDGFHESRVLIPAEARRRLFGLGRASLQNLAKAGIESAGKMENALRRAIFAYLQGGPARISMDDDTARTMAHRFQIRFQALWSDAFFPWLWSVPVPIDEEKALTNWVMKLKDLASTVLREVEYALPGHAGRNYRARVVAERVFYGNVYSSFPFLKEDYHAAG